MVGRLVVRFLVWGRLADDGAAARVACALATAHASSLSLPFLPATQTAEYVCLVRAGGGGAAKAGGGGGGRKVAA